MSCPLLQLPEQLEKPVPAVDLCGLQRNGVVVRFRGAGREEGSGGRVTTLELGLLIWEVLLWVPQMQAGSWLAYNLDTLQALRGTLDHHPALIGFTAAVDFHAVSDAVATHDSVWVAAAAATAAAADISAAVILG